jgi:hypothetical protein
MFVMPTMPTACTPPRCEPTPAEIAAAAADIRAEWDAAEERKRRTTPPQPWRLPQVSLQERDA